MSKILAVFDFDHTVIEMNSDIVLKNLLPKEIAQGEKLLGLRPSWTAYMGEVFRQLHQHGFTKSDIENTCRDLVATIGIITLIKFLHDLHAEILILSDANVETISIWIEKHLPDVPIKIFSNGAVWKDNGVLQIKSYHQQTSCKECPVNLCKGAVMHKHLCDKDYDLVVYVGDGKNDLCAAEKLRECDLVCARSQHMLEKLLEHRVLAARVCIWTSGLEIIEAIKDKLGSMQ